MIYQKEGYGVKIGFSSLFVSKGMGISMMLLMFQDMEVMSFSDNYTDVVIYNENMLPKELLYEIVDTSQFNSKNQFYANNRYAIANWLSSRVLTLQRRNSKAILNSCRYSQSVSAREKICISCRAVSVRDSYWLKREDEDITWDSVNVRKNKLSDVVLDIALKGFTISLNNNDFMNPEISTCGVSAKSWLRKDGKLYLVKSTNEYANSVWKELLASKILDCFNVNNLQYFPYDYKGMSCSICECMADEEVSVVSAYSVLGMFGFDEEEFYNYVKEHFSTDYYKMIIVDYIIANTDRHDENWGFYMDNNTMELVGLHKLYDHDNSFDEMFHHHIPCLTMPGFNMFDACKYALTYVDIQLTGEIDLGWFGDFDYLASKFLERLKDVGVRFHIIDNKIKSIYGD